MINKKQKEVLSRAIVYYGVDNQLNVAVEELSELTKEICKFNRNYDNHEHIVEEIADVIIMIEQLKQIFNIDENEIKKAIDFKINRLERNFSYGESKRGY